MPRQRKGEIFTLFNCPGLRPKREIGREEVTIVSVDAINMYPSIKLATIKKAVRFFARTLTTATKKTINLCLELIHFGMSSTLI